MTLEVTQELRDRQKENEHRQITGGVNDYNKSIEKDRAKRRFGCTRPGAWLIEQCFPKLEEAIGKRIEEALTGKPGRHSFVVNYLHPLEPGVIAYVTLRTLLDCTARHDMQKTAVARKIGLAIREELEHLSMKEQKPKAYDYWTQRAREATHGTTRKRCLEKLKSLCDRSLFQNIKDEDTIYIGLACIDDAKEHCGIVLEYRQRRGKKTQDFLELAPYFVEKVEEFNRHHADRWPWHDPMLVPPKPWDGAFGGGYVGELGRRSKLVRTANKKYLEELHLNRDKLQPVFDALNAIQGTPWRINRKVFDVMDAAWASNGAAAYGLPLKQEKPLPAPPPGYDKDDKLRQDYAFLVQEARDENRTNHGHRFALSRILGTAWLFAEEKAIYFPHNLDWRGRIYPVARYLTPQGSEYSQAILEFAEGKPLGTEQAAGWLAVHGANCFGIDKVSFEERVAWVQENEGNIRKSAAAPLDYRWWVGADTPWKFLAWCFDWVGYLDNGLAHVSHLPVSMDGSCNGLQNFTAMLRDPETAKAVNLAPADKPNDIYQQVADVVAERVHALASSRKEDIKTLEDIVRARTQEEINLGEEGDATRRETGELWDVLAAKFIDGQITRNLVKQPVMTYPYAVTEAGVKLQLKKKLQELNRKGKIDFPYKHSSKIAYMLKVIVFQAVREEVRAAALAMDWLKSVAKTVAKHNKPISWYSPAGLLVVQEYKKTKVKKVNTQIGSLRVQQTITQELSDIDPPRQARAMAPNFVHSCDAAHLMRTVNACTKRGITAFHMIHDSYGTHAANAGALARTLREEFISMYSGNVLQDFLDNLAHFLPPEVLEGIKPPPRQGGFDLNKVAESRYFFA